MTDRDAVCWHCLDCVTVPARTRCEHCPEECDIEGCDAPGCNGQVATVSPWRSLKDDPPTKAPVLIRRGQSASWRFGAQIAPWLPVSGYFLERGYTEWMEVPE